MTGGFLEFPKMFHVKQFGKIAAKSRERKRTDFFRAFAKKAVLLVRLRKSAAGGCERFGSRA
jgi:hypothetical protein